MKKILNSNDNYYQFAQRLILSAPSFEKEMNWASQFRFYRLVGEREIIGTNLLIEHRKREYKAN